MSSEPRSDRALTAEFIHRLPKAELHVHLDGSLRPATMVELARDHHVALPTEDPNALGRTMVASDVVDLDDYLERFRLTLSVMQSEEALERIAFELVEDGAREGVRYMEVRFAPLLNTRAGLSHAQVVESALRGMRGAGERYGVRTGLIICALRSLPPGSSLEMAEVAATHVADGVVGFDLAGGEDGFPAQAHLGAFGLATEAGIPITIHAGEAFGPDSIRQAVVVCGAQRIGHGTRLREDPALQNLIRERGIPLEVCPTSNVQTRVAPSLADHPIGEYLDAGVPVTLSTDNRLISGVDLSTEYLDTARAQGWGWTEIRALARAGFEHAFLHGDEKTAMLAEVDRELAELDAELARGHSGDSS